MNHFEFSILIVNYKTLEFTRQCLGTVRLCSRGSSYEIIVIDNDSNDESSNYLRQQTDICLIERKDGLCYDARDHGQSLDVAARRAKGKYMVIVDSDIIILREGWLENLRSILVKERAVLIGPSFYRNFVHACLLMVERDVFKKNNLSFSARTYFHHYYDTAEYVTRKLLMRGYRIMGLESYIITGSEIMGPIKGASTKEWVDRWWDLAKTYGAYIGGLGYHYFYGTRQITSNCDGSLFDVKNRKIDLQMMKDVNTKYEMRNFLLTDKRSLFKRLKERMLFILRAFFWVLSRVFKGFFRRLS